MLVNTTQAHERMGVVIFDVVPDDVIVQGNPMSPTQATVLGRLELASVSDIGLARCGP